MSVHGPLRPLSLSSPWLGMILILPLGVLVFLEWLLSPSAPPQPPQSSETLAWSGWPESHLTSCLPSPSPEGPQSMVNFSGDFLGEILALPSKCFGTP